MIYICVTGSNLTITAGEILIADECWVALAKLHRGHPDRKSFSGSEILDELRITQAHPSLRAGVQPHIYLHNVANAAPNPARHRLFYRLAEGTYRLFRPGDDYHPARTGKTRPRQTELPACYHDLIDWYEREYCAGAAPARPEEDPVLRMRGVGKELWAEEGGDAFVARLRAEWFSGTPRLSKPFADEVWDRVVAHQGKPFRVSGEGLCFTYTVDENRALSFYQGGAKLEAAFDHWLAVLSDPRIHGAD